jgi:3-hydroxyisobutyrate dehydrogenase-like beta-hydroxyacid dehydrogenase
MNNEHIGFIGTGLMGHGMAKNIVEKGYPLIVTAHRNRAPVDDLIGRGATEATIEDLAARSTIIFLTLPGSPQVSEAVAKMTPHLKPGSVIVDCSTSDPTVTERLATDLSAKGIHFADAPSPAHRKRPGRARSTAWSAQRQRSSTASSPSSPPGPGRSSISGAWVTATG